MKRYIPKLVYILALTVIVVGVFGPLAHAQYIPNDSQYTTNNTNTATTPAAASTNNTATTPATAAVSTSVANTAATAPSAIGSIAKLFNLDFQGFFNELIASVMDTLLTAMGFNLAISGALLNFSINLTLHIRDFVNESPAIYSTWKAIRDISGLFIIFALLYAAIKMILGFDAKFGELIKNIVIAGVLINFSFFFAGLGVDASNIVSVQLYNAIAPSNSLSTAAATEPIIGPKGISFSKMDGGLSDIFMNNLKVQKVYQQSLAPNGSGPLTPIKIFLAGVIGIMIELAATISFLAATLAFIVRFVMLLLLLAFSPVWFAAHVVPMTQEYSKKWTETYKGMLIFMPVYLLLMYLALNVLTSSPLLTGTAAAPTDPWYAGFLSLGVNAVIVIFLLNMPLVAAVSVAGTTLKFIDTKKLGAGAMWGKLGKYTQQYTQRGAAKGWETTGGRAASKIAQNENFKTFAGNWKVGELALKGTRAAGAKYEEKLTKQVESRTKFAESLGADQRKLNEAQAELRERQKNLASARSAGGSKPSATQASIIAGWEDRVGESKGKVAGIEASRKQAYSDRISTRTLGLLGGADSLFFVIARKEKVAAAKIQIPILEKELTQRTASLKETQADIKQLSNQIKNNPAIGTDKKDPGYVEAGTATDAQKDELKILQGKEEEKTNKTALLEARIDKLKLTK